MTKKGPGMHALKNNTQLLRHLARFAYGYASQRKQHNTWPGAYYSMRQLFCATDGRFNDAVAFLEGLRHPNQRSHRPHGILGSYSPKDLQRVIQQLDRQGFYIFEERLPDAWIAQLTRYALETPCQPRGEDFTSQAPCLYPQKNPTSIRYDFSPQQIAEQPLVQKLLMDPSILAVAGAYLHAEPINDLLAMWWSALPSQEVSSADKKAAAQAYHFDMDRIKFLKFFFYLTDVTSETGPHCYVAHSHKRKPKALREDRRISDEEIARHYPPEDLRELTGGRGSIIAVDTRGFHKGKPLQQGERLILQLEFATSLFGQNYPRIQCNDKFSQAFLAFAQENPRIFANYEW